MAKCKENCECGRHTRSKLNALRHGHTWRDGKAHRGTGTYISWFAMKQRVTNPRHTSYKNYGGRGITICDKWYLFDNFLEDMGERPPGHSIDRINNDGNYEPGNCRWATRIEQNNNQRARKRISND